MIHWNRRKYSQREFEDAWKSSLSIAECARKLNLSVFGSTYQTLKLTAKELNLSDDHMLGQAWNVGGKFVPKTARPIENVLVYGKPESSHGLKLRLFKLGIKDRRCEICKLSSWLGKEIPLELDHINGDRLDHRLENLRILCSNCHAQTDNYAGKGKRKVLA